MSLNAAIKLLNAAFTSPTTGFGEVVWHLPSGVIEDKVAYNAVVDWDAEEGQNNVRGDGRAINQDRGRATRQSLVIELASTVQISESGRDQFQVTDPVSESVVTVGVKRIIGRDAGMQSVLCIRTTEHQAQAARRLG